MTRASLRYERVRGRTVEPPPARERRRVDHRTVSAWAVSFFVVAAIVGLVLAGDAWGPGIWTGIAPGRPGSGYGFAATTGVLLSCAGAAVILPFIGISWEETWGRRLTRCAAALPGALASLPALVVIFGAWRPKRGGGLECFDAGHPCWVHEQYPYVWAACLAAALACAGLLAPLLLARVRRHKALARTAT